METEIVEMLKKRHEKVACMESCTSGLLSSTFTNVPGSSEVLEVGLVTYSNYYKEKFGVSKQVIEKYSVYSIETARQMAKAVSAFASSCWGIGVTGQIGEADPNNLGQKINIIYSCIYYVPEDRYIDIIISLDNGKTRKENKEKIVEDILMKFYQIIKEG